MRVSSIRPSTCYGVPDATTRALNGLVARIQANPGRMIRPGEFDELQERVQARAAGRNLPDGLDSDDLAGILRLTLLTECATESYARLFEGGAARYAAPWLGRFVRDVWTPDEQTHADPYKLMLLDLGYGDAELDDQVRETQQREYRHAGGETPFHLTVFGMLQEHLTDTWHGLVARLLEPGAPEAAWMATRIKRRETLHSIWYRDMSALQLEGNPALLGHLVETLLLFKMPGNSLVPELQASAHAWMPAMGLDHERLRKDLVRLMHHVVGDVRTTGALMLQLAAERGDRLGPLRAKHVRAAVNRLGGPGQGLLGEALLERVGLGYLFRDGTGVDGDAGMVGRLRGLLRRWIARQIDLEFKRYGAPAHGAADVSSG